jgi:hypothetical protein
LTAIEDLLAEVFHVEAELGGFEEIEGYVFLPFSRKSMAK